VTKRSRKKLVSGAILSGMVLLLLSILAVLLSRTPRFYDQAEARPSIARTGESDRVVGMFSDVRTALEGREPAWGLEFNDQEMNSFLQEGAVNLGMDSILPKGFHDPRLKIEDDKLRLGIRYGTGVLSTILTIEMRAWRIPSEDATIGVQLVSLKAGAMPLPLSILLDRITEFVRSQGIDVTWYRMDGKPVGVFRFQYQLTRPTYQFESLTLQDGQFRLRCRSTEMGKPK